MCLEYDKKWTKHFTKKYTKYFLGIPVGRKEVTAYKVYQLNKKHQVLLSMYQCHTCNYQLRNREPDERCPILNGEPHINNFRERYMSECDIEGRLIPQAGIIQSNRKNKQLGSIEADDRCYVDWDTGYTSDWAINRGIHVYLTYKYAENAIESYDKNGVLPHRQEDILVIVPVQCDIKDLIGVNRNYTEAALMEVAISSEAFETAINT